MREDRIAILSDIHANSDALRAVLRDIYPSDQSPRAGHLWFLGDLLGYGPDPVGVIHLVSGQEDGWPAFDRLLGGNHDAYFGPWSEITRMKSFYNEQARFSLLVHEAMLHETLGRFSVAGRELTVEQWARQSFGPASYELLDETLGQVRALARHSMLETELAQAFRYVFPWCLSRLQELFASLVAYHDADQPHLCYFFGHTHVPLFCSQEGMDLVFHDLRFNDPQPLPRGTCLINPGSVGQPRGGNDHYEAIPSYVILDPGAATIEFRRVDRRPPVTGLYELGDAANRFPFLADPLGVEQAAWPEHCHKMVQWLIAIFGGLHPLPDWSLMPKIYRRRDWGWEGQRVCLDDEVEIVC